MLNALSGSHSWMNWGGTGIKETGKVTQETGNGH